MYGSTLSTRHFQLSSCSIALIPSFTSNFDSLLACFWHQHPPIDEIGSEYERCTETKNNRIGSFPSQYPINILSRAHLYISQLHFLDLVLHLLPCMHSWIPTGVLIHVSGPQCFHPRESLLQRKLLHFLVLATSMHDNTCMLLVPQGMLASTTRRIWLAFLGQQWHDVEPTILSCWDNNNSPVNDCSYKLSTTTTAVLYSQIPSCAACNGILLLQSGGKQVSLLALQPKPEWRWKGLVFCRLKCCWAMFEQ